MATLRVVLRMAASGAVSGNISGNNQRFSSRGVPATAPVNDQTVGKSISSSLAAEKGRGGSSLSGGRKTIAAAIAMIGTASSISSKALILLSPVEAIRPEIRIRAPLANSIPPRSQPSVAAALAPGK